MIKRSQIRKVRSKPRPGRLKGAELEALRIACWERDKGICQAMIPDGRIVFKCETQTFMELPHTAPNSYHMAHITAKRRGGDYLENVRTLCGDCHRKEHMWGKSMQKPVPKKIDTDYILGAVLNYPGG